MTESTVSSRENKLSRKYELVVIGGGFHGACAFEQAAARGVDVLLVERGDFCSGASANSLKTVHGGIRFLQKGDIRRLRYSARARQLWAARAPRLVKPLPCVLPLPRSLLTAAPFVRIGALAYELLTIDRRSGIPPELSLKQPGVVSRDRYEELAAPFRDPDAKHGLRWEDYQVVDSERLVMDIIRAGERAGGHAINYVEALDIVSHGADLTVPVHDRLHDRESQVRTHSVISFAGSAPGDSEFPGCSANKRSRPVLAVNIVIDRPLVSGGVAFRPEGQKEPSNRYLFCVPWQGSTILGTWYLHAPELTDEGIIAHRLADIDKMLADVNKALQGARVSRGDVTRIHWGWLPGNWDIKDDAEASLVKDPLVVANSVSAGTPKNILIEGPKFTTANLIATDGLKKTGIDLGGFTGGPISPVLTEEQRRKLQHVGQALEISSETMQRLGLQYGSSAVDILDIAEQHPDLLAPIDCAPATLQAEIAYCVLREQALQLPDVVFRRTGIGGAGVPEIEMLRCCARVMAPFRGWNNDEVDNQIRRIMSLPLGGRWIDI
jgi:glycerol-3-phosphate dehydrogenase